MADDWKAGDLALCVAVRHPRYRGASRILRKGRIYTVESVRWSNQDELVALFLVGCRSRKSGAWPADIFRKIEPLTDAEREEALRELNTPERVS
jgi:hypothetical protein